MRVLILGGDGYLGWPTAMHFSARGHDVMVVDNYLRRSLCREADCEPLTPVENLHQRVERWQKAGHPAIELIIGDLTDYQVMAQAIEQFEPDAVIHYAEQPSAPYSMLGRRQASLTLNNNLTVTLNLILAVYEFAPQAHIIKLGTMGEYGTPNIDIEEGWIDIEHKGRSGRFLFPRQAGSLYHTTKIMDTDLLWFYVRTWGLRVTDLMQGPVYGTHIVECARDPELFPFFHYDEIFGTVINRFVVQAVADYPLTIYGGGSQTRGYLDINDTMACVRLAAEYPAKAGELRIFNQFTETFSVNELAERVARVGRAMGMNVAMQTIKNPRVEAEEHYYNPSHSGLIELGHQPTLLSDELLAGMLEFVQRHKANIRRESIYRGVNWR